MAGFNNQITSLHQPLRSSTQAYAVIVETLAVLGAANETPALIKQHYPDLSATLADDKFHISKSQSREPYCRLWRTNPTPNPEAAYQLHDMEKSYIVLGYSRRASWIATQMETSQQNP